MSYLKGAKVLKAKIDKNQEIVETVEAAGGIRVADPVQSDKLGFDWARYYVNDILVKSDYVEQENPAGIADNPIIWTDDMILIPNAYYQHDGIRKVWTGGAGVVASWDDPGFVIF